MSLHGSRIRLTLLLVSLALIPTPASSLRADTPRTTDAARRTDKERPNVVLILSDDQAWTDYGFMGHPRIRTPHLDRLASQSAVFPWAHVPTALCRPSLATIVTGLYPHQHGIVGNDPMPPAPAAKGAKDPEADAAYARLRERLIAKTDGLPTLPRRLAEHGYACFQAGKWWEGSWRRGGFTEGMTRGFPEPGGRHGDDGLAIGRQGLQPVRDFIHRSVADGQPFFVWYAPMLPHSPHDPPERLLARHAVEGQPTPVARYHATCEWFDETCGELLGILDKEGVADSTIVVYTGDNGWLQDPGSSGYQLRSKQSPYETGVRQPLLLRWPKVVEAGQRDEVVSTLDLLPTLLEATGAARVDGLPGQSLLPLLRDRQPLAREAIFGEGYAHDVADLDRPERSLLYRWVIEGRWKLLLTYDGVVVRDADQHPRKERGPQLYDLQADPFERRNLAPQHPEVTRRLAQRLEQWWPVRETRLLSELPQPADTQVQKANP